MMRPTVASETAKPSALSSGPSLARPHMGWSSLSRSIAVISALLQPFARTLCGRRERGFDRFSQR